MLAAVVCGANSHEFKCKMGSPASRSWVAAGDRRHCRKASPFASRGFAAQVQEPGLPVGEPAGGELKPIATLPPGRTTHPTLLSASQGYDANNPKFR